MSVPFRRAYWGQIHSGGGWPRAEMEHASAEGVQILRALSLAVRSEQDFRMTGEGSAVVGAIKKTDAAPSEADDVKRRGGYAAMLTVEG